MFPYALHPKLFNLFNPFNSIYGLGVLGIGIGVLSAVAFGADFLEAYRDAVTHNPSLRSAAAGRLAVQEAPHQARALLLPTVSARLVEERNFGVTSSNPRSDGAFASHNYSLNIVQPLYNQEAHARVRQALSTAEQADTEYLATEQELIVRVAERYFTVLANLDTLTFASAEKGAIQRQLEQAQRRFEVGLITITDVLEAQARYDLATADEISARNAVATSWEALREVTGRYYDHLYTLTDEGTQQPNPMAALRPDPADPEMWVEVALQNNPRLISTSFAIEAARENVNVQRAGNYPRLDLVAGYFDAQGQNSESTGHQIGLQLNIPLYQGGAISSRVREAAFRHEAAKENLEQLQRATVRQVRDAYRSLQADVSRIRALNQARVSNQSALEATEAGFEVGTRTIVDVLDAQRNLFRARRDYSIARYQYVLNYLSLLQGAGRIGEEDVNKVNALLEPPATSQP